MRLRALAKINLGLDILRKREDGYHEAVSYTHLDVYKRQHWNVGGCQHCNDERHT